MLKFNKDGKFKIMQIADVQEIPEVSPDTLFLMNSALDREKPDLAVFTGDQLQSYNKAMKTGDRARNAEELIGKITKPLTDRKVPFTVTYGNHDNQSGVSNAQQAQMYEKLHGCTLGTPRTAEDRGTFSLQIFDSEGEKAIFNLYIIDSGGMTKDGYDPVSKEQIDWYRAERERIKNEYGDYLPSFVFQHIPLPEVFCGLESTTKKADGAIPGFRSHAHQYYRLPDNAPSGSFFRESPLPSDTNNGEFEAFTEKGEVVGVFFGHDHMNSFIVNYKGIDIGYTQGTGFNVYGPGRDRGVRVFEISQDNPRKYNTHTLTYAELTDGRVQRRFFDFVFRHAPMKLLKWVYSHMMSYFSKG